MNTENTLLQSREEEGGSFERALVSSEFVDWLLLEGEMATREEAEKLGRRLLEHGIIQHGEEDEAAVPVLLYTESNFNGLKYQATPASFNLCI